MKLDCPTWAGLCRGEGKGGNLAPEINVMMCLAVVGRLA